MQQKKRIFVTGGTGYLGSRLIPRLAAAGHQVTALARPQSRGKLPQGCGVALGDALNAGTYKECLTGVDTLVQLVGVAHPGPSKARQFVEIDQKSAQEAIRAAAGAGVAHFVYVSVAHPAPVMHAYTKVRAECEQTLRESGLNATILRPWYILGPGHRWPYALLPFYKVAEMIPSMRESARRLGLVTLEQMLCALVDAVNHPADGVRVMEVPEIRGGGAVDKQAATRVLSEP